MGSGFFTPSSLLPCSAISQRSDTALNRQISLLRELSPVIPTEPSGLQGGSILHPPGVQWGMSACVRTSRILEWYLTGETSPDPKVLCAMSAEQGPMEGRRHTGNRTRFSRPTSTQRPPCSPRAERGLRMPEFLRASLQELHSEMLGPRAFGMASPPAGSRGSSSCCTSRA